jgi:membrane fusion protein (multidrug efflux system)
MVDNMIGLLNRNQADERPQERAMTAAANSLASAPPSAAQQKSNLRALIVPATAIIVAFVAVGASATRWDTWVATRSVQSTDDAAVYADISAVSARVGGTVETISVEDYAQVKAGDPIFSIDRKPYEVALRGARARLAAANAQLDDNDTQRAFQLTQIDVAIAQQQAAAADEVAAEKELQRQTRLGLDGRVSTVQSFEKATAAHERALANLDVARANVAAQRVKLDILARQRDILKANLDTAGSDLATRELELGYTNVRAPVDGIVARRNAQVGNYVAAGTPLISIVPLPKIYILANYKENQLSMVHEGQPVDISVDLLPGAAFHGTVSKISPATGSTFALLPADNATGNFTKVAQRLTVRIELDPDQPNFDRLRPGMSVTTHIATKDEDHV